MDDHEGPWPREVTFIALRKGASLRSVTGSMDDHEGPWPREVTFIALRKGASLRSV